MCVSTFEAQSLPRSPFMGVPSNELGRWRVSVRMLYIESSFSMVYDLTCIKVCLPALSFGKPLQQNLENWLKKKLTQGLLVLSR